MVPQDSRALEEQAAACAAAKDYSFATAETLIASAPAQRRRLRIATQKPHQGSGDSLTLGLYNYGPMAGITIFSSQHPQLCNYLNQFLLHHCHLSRDDKLQHPVWTSLSISRNLPIRPHLDAHNMSKSRNITLSLGQFKGGELWLELRPKDAEALKSSHNQIVQKVKPNGARVSGILMSTHNKVRSFSPKRYHATHPWQGSRISITAFVGRSVPQLPKHLEAQLQSLGFPVQGLRQLARSDSCSDNPGRAWAEWSSALIDRAGPNRPVPTVTSQQSDASNLSVQHAGTEALPPPQARGIIPSAMSIQPTTYARLALVVEEMPSAASVLQDAGWRIEHLHHNHLLGPAAVHVAQRIRNLQIHALWIDLPHKGRHIRADRMHSALVQMCTWFRQAVAADIPCALFGAYGGQWLQAPVADLVGQGVLAKSYHRMCHFNFRVDPRTTQPSKACFVCASFPSFPSHTCNCVQPQREHVLDWTTNPQSRRLRGQAHMAMVRHVATRWLDNAVPGRSTPDYPAAASANAPPAAKASSSFDLLLARMSDFKFKSSRDFGAPELEAANIPGPTVAPPFARVLEPTVNPSSARTQLQSFTSAKTSETPNHCYPTEARMQQKERAKLLKARGLQPRKRQTHVEDHHDDCGTSLESLAPYLSKGPEALELQQHSALYLCADALPPEWILGSKAAPDLPQQPCTCHIASGFTDLLAHIALWPTGETDTLYIGGGRQAYVTVAVHRVHAPCRTSQAITQFASGSPEDQERLGRYLKHHNPLVVIVAPDPEDPTACRLASLAAAYQLKSHHFLICEQLSNTALYECPPWKSFLQLPSTVQVRVPGSSHTDRHVCANHAALLSPLRAFLADNPSFTCGPSELSSRVSECLSDGVSLLRTCLYLMPNTGQQQMAFPSAAVGPGPPHAEEAAPAPTEEQWRKCPGCRGRQARYDDRHTRVRGQCKFPDDTPHTWTCPGCKYHRPLTHSSHSFGPDCKRAIVEGRAGARRKGRHPRAPARPASDAPGADLQAQLPGGGDLGEAEEEEAERREPEGASSSASAAPAHPPGHPLLEGLDPTVANDIAEMLRSPDDVRPPQAPEEEAPQSPAAEPSSGRAPRSRRAVQDAGSGPENPADWTRYDISRSLKVLRTGSERAVLVELRKLHLRLWHAGRQSMTAILRAAGLSNKVLDLIPSVIETCRECRNWQPPKPNTQHSLSVSMVFNEHLEVDLMFYREHIIFHGVDRATRWHAATTVASKEGEVLFEALSTCWINTFGPPKFLVCDGEGGFWRPEIMARIRRMGTEPKLRAPEQHARYVERRGAILRGTLHLIEEQLEREELVYPFATTLSEAVFAGNTCTHVGGSTPYQAVFGRQPAFLPPLDAPDLPNLDESSERGELQRARVRAAALQGMIQATTMAKLNRASRTRTSHPTEHLFREGELIDIHRKPSSKDASGWSGPHRVVRVEPGQVVVSIRGVDRTYRAQDARHSLLVFLTVGASNTSSECLALVEQELQRISPGQSQFFGFAVSPSGQWELTTATKKKPQVLHALEVFVFECMATGRVLRCAPRPWRQKHVISARCLSLHPTVVDALH